MAGNEEFSRKQDNSQELELSDKELDSVPGGLTKGNLSTHDMQQLQQALEQKGQLEQMISNTMKATGETSSGIASNLK